MRAKPIAAAIFLSLLTALPLHAGVVERDFQNPGDGLLTYDEVNQREWLDLTETIDWSLADLLEGLSSNGPLQGFFLANKEDVSGLATSAGVEWLLPGQAFPVVEGNSAKNLIDLVGTILDYNKSNELLDPNGISNDFDDLVEFNILEVLGLRASVGVIGEISLIERDTITYNLVSIISVGGRSLSNLNPLLIDLAREGGGILSGFQPLPEPISGPFWLFRSTAIPEPSSVALAVIGAIAVFSRRHRRRRSR